MKSILITGMDRRGTTGGAHRPEEKVANIFSGKGVVLISLRRYICLSAALMLGTATSYPASAKHMSFQMPTQQKLTSGASPQSELESSAQPTAPLDLSPVGLTDEKSNQAESDGEANGLLKSTVTETKFIGKDQAGTSSNNAVDSGKSVSLVGKKAELGDKVLKDGGKKVDVAPLALMETDSEAEQKAEVSVDAEKHQLSDLWNSTMGRNPDIQFVINKLQPTEDQNHAMATTMKALSTVLFGAMNVAPMMIPGGLSGANPGALMGASAGSSLIQSLFVSKSEKEAKKHAISQEQATILYKIVRDTADKLVGSYRDYKKDITSLDRASNDLQDLQSMVAEVRGTQDAAKQVEMEYTLRKARREIDKEAEEARRRRQELVDLAGDEAVCKLDQELQEEREALAKLTGNQERGSDTSVFVNPLASMESPKKTAGNPAAQIH